jgi:signal transduction histidine kinase
VEAALRVAGLVVWVVVGSPRWVQLPRTGVHGADAAWTVAYVAYALAFGLATHPPVARAVRKLLLALESALAVFLACVGMPHFEGALLAVVAAQAGPILGTRSALACAVLQAPALFAIVLPTHGALGALKATGEYLAFALFAVTVHFLREREAAGRRELAYEHAKLLATQSLLADSIRTDERLRMTRDVHDAIGHGLAAASVHLELAIRTELAARANGSAGDASSMPAAKAARDAVRQTLRDLRALVAATPPQGDTAGLSAALRALCAGIHEPAVKLTLPADLRVRDAACKHALFRCVQESLTNALKHAGATRVWVEVTTEAARTVVVVGDDGKGCARVEPGFGLETMRSRMSEVGGEAEFESAPGQGFVLRAWVPAS